MAYGYVHERIDILGFLWWLGGMPDQTRIDNSGALSPEEGKRGRIGPLNPAAQGIEDQEIIKKILTHLDLRMSTRHTSGG